MAIKVYSLWEKHDFLDSKFSECAQSALEFCKLHEHLDPFEFLKTRISARKMYPYSVREHGSDGVFIVKVMEKFNIYIHFWGSNMAKPHSHEWDGAYQILSGQALHALYKFTLSEKIRHFFVLGELNLRELIIQKPGCIQSVTAGPEGTIHNMAYITPIGMAISIRKTAEYPKHRLSLTWNRPYVAYETSHTKNETTNATMVERIRAFEWMRKIDQTLYDKETEQFCRESNLPSIYAFLTNMVSHRQAISKDIAQIGLDRFGKTFGKIMSSLDDIKRDKLITTTRNQTTDKDLYFFLAALYVCDNKSQLHNAIALQYGDKTDPTNLIVKWLGELLINVDEGGATPQPLVDFFQETVTNNNAELEPICKKIKQRHHKDENINHYIETMRSLYGSVSASPVYTAIFQ